ncbi:MAG: D-aminoacyl-tRNA deacylase [Armatimonadota bacterium]|nr:D-aminoacyl-tRNA deacylase [Armatimonadota bacterium]
MRAVVQRSLASRVVVDGQEVGSIDHGLVVLLGVGKEDGPNDASWMADKIANLRIFGDENEKMNISLLDVGGQALVISQFTLYGDCRKGRRPGFDGAAPPEKADELYQLFVEKLREAGVPVQTGRFRAMMLVEIQNQGPVTLLLDSRGSG